MPEEAGNSYSVPQTDGIATGQDADRALRQFQADIRDTSHPFWDGNNPTQKDWIDFQRHLYRVKTESEAAESTEDSRITEPDHDGRPPTEAQKVMRRAMLEQEDQQDERVDRATDVMDELVELGFNKDSIPDDITDTEVVALQIQRHAAKSEWDEGLKQLEQLVDQVPRVDQLARDGLRMLRQYPNLDMREDLLKQVLQAVVDADHLARGNKPRRDRKDEGE